MKRFLTALTTLALIVAVTTPAHAVRMRQEWTPYLAYFAKYCDVDTNSDPQTLTCPALSGNCVGGASNDCGITIKDNTDGCDEPDVGFLKICSDDGVMEFRKNGGASTVATGETSTGGDHITLDGTDLDLDAEVITHQGCVVIKDMATDKEYYTIWRAPVALTIVEIYCEVTGGTDWDLDLEIDDGTPASVNGSDIACDTSGVTDGTLAGDVTMAVGDRLDIDSAELVGNVTQAAICIKWTVDDV